MSTSNKYHRPNPLIAEHRRMKEYSSIGADRTNTTYGTAFNHARAEVVTLENGIWNVRTREGTSEFSQFLNEIYAEAEDKWTDVTTQELGDLTYFNLYARPCPSVLRRILKYALCVEVPWTAIESFPWNAVYFAATKRCFYADMIWIAQLDSHETRRASKQLKSDVVEIAMETLGFPVADIVSKVVKTEQRKTTMPSHPLGSAILTYIRRSFVGLHLMKHHPVIFARENMTYVGKEFSSPAGRACAACCPVEQFFEVAALTPEQAAEHLTDWRDVLADSVADFYKKSLPDSKAPNMHETTYTKWSLKVRELLGKSNRWGFVMPEQISQVYVAGLAAGINDEPPFEDAGLEKFACSFGRRVLRTMGEESLCNRDIRFVAAIENPHGHTTPLICSSLHSTLADLSKTFSDTWKCVHSTPDPRPNPQEYAALLGPSDSQPQTLFRLLPEMSGFLMACPDNEWTLVGPSEKATEKAVSCTLHGNLGTIPVANIEDFITDEPRSTSLRAESDYHDIDSLEPSTCRATFIYSGETGGYSREPNEGYSSEEDPSMETPRVSTVTERKGTAVPSTSSYPHRTVTFDDVPMPSTSGQGGKHTKASKHLKDHRAAASSSSTGAIPKKAPVAGKPVPAPAPVASSSSTGAIPKKAPVARKPVPAPAPVVSGAQSTSGKRPYEVSSPASDARDPHHSSHPKVKDTPEVRVYKKVCTSESPPHAVESQSILQQARVDEEEMEQDVAHSGTAGESSDSDDSHSETKKKDSESGHSEKEGDDSEVDDEHSEEEDGELQIVEEPPEDHSDHDYPSDHDVPRCASRNSEDYFEDQDRPRKGKRKERPLLTDDDDADYMQVVAEAHAEQRKLLMQMTNAIIYAFDKAGLWTNNILDLMSAVLSYQEAATLMKDCPSVLANATKRFSDIIDTFPAFEAKVIRAVIKKIDFRFAARGTVIIGQLEPHIPGCEIALTLESEKLDALAREQNTGSVPSSSSQEVQDLSLPGTRNVTSVEDVDVASTSAALNVVTVPVNDEPSGTPTVDTVVPASEASTSTSQLPTHTKSPILSTGGLGLVPVVSVPQESASSVDPEESAPSVDPEEPTRVSADALSRPAVEEAAPTVPLTTAPDDASAMRVVNPPPDSATSRDPRTHPSARSRRQHARPQANAALAAGPSTLSTMFPPTASSSSGAVQETVPSQLLDSPPRTQEQPTVEFSPLQTRHARLQNKARLPPVPHPSFYTKKRDKDHL